MNVSNSTTLRKENGDIVHTHHSTHRGNNATLVTSTTTTIHHHHHHHHGSLGAGVKALTSSLGPPLPAPASSTTTTTTVASMGHHHHHHLHPPPLSSAALAAPLDPAQASIVASASFQGDLHKIDMGLNSEDADVQLEAAKKLRVLLSSERDLLIRQVSAFVIPSVLVQNRLRWAMENNAVLTKDCVSSI